MKAAKSILILLLCLALGLSACSAGAKNGAEAAVSPGEALDRPAETAAPAAEGKLEGAVEEAYDYAADGGLGEFYAEAEKSGAEPLYGEAAAPDPGEALEEPVVIDDPAPVEPPVQGAEALILTAAEWNDNQNWPFFTNLVNSGTVSFPAYGIDPRNRVQVTVTDAAGAPLVNETVRLYGAGDELLWTARTDKEGTAYLFWTQNQSPERAACGESAQELLWQDQSEDPQGAPVAAPAEALALTAEPAAPAQEALQVMFIVDTTGSMGDELAYLQKDFAAIAQRVGTEGVSYAVSFYRDEGDEYVTKYEGFTDEVETVQRRINAEYASGGGDEPEAVAEILTLCLTDCPDWREDCAKLAFLIFDAPPHEGREAELLAAVQAAAEQGIRLVPVVASNAQRDTELFGRALSICTNGSYVFLTDDSGVGSSHLEPIVGSYSVELLQDIIVRLIEEARP